jgi:hypothetical protein
VGRPLGPPGKTAERAGLEGDLGAKEWDAVRGDRAEMLSRAAGWIAPVSRRWRDTEDS